VFRRLFSKRNAPKADTPLAGAPAVRRLKNYSAQTGYVYQYFYEGHRSYSGDGVEFVFTVSADRKAWNLLSVIVSGGALRSRDLTTTEQYAVAKMALFQAFDERSGPALMRDPVHVRPADLEAILDKLNL
jgi:hypothetical protein